MPTYEYACAACGHEWEQTQRITEPPVELCPACAKSAAHRLISAGTNFILKGGGWYSDLYSSPKASAEKGEKAEKSGGTGEAPSAAPAKAGGSESDKSASKGAATETSKTSATPSASSPAPSSSAPST